MAFSLLQLCKAPFCCGDSLIILPFPPTIKHSDPKGRCTEEIISPLYNRTNRGSGGSGGNIKNHTRVAGGGGLDLPGLPAWGGWGQAEEEASVEVADERIPSIRWETLFCL